MMRFFFDEQRAAQAAARLLSRHGGPMHGAMLAHPWRKSGPSWRRRQTRRPFLDLGQHGLSCRPP